MLTTDCLKTILLKGKLLQNKRFEQLVIGNEEGKTDNKINKSMKIRLDPPCIALLFT